jgi:2-methylisocitrate lyase-like PEP mutase family enzyme
MGDEQPSLMTRLAEPRLLTAAGVFDALSAVLAERAGFEAVFLSGSALAYTQLGRPDVGLLTATELAAIVGRVCERVDLPVLVDADYGFGNAMNVFRTVRLLERAGASGIQLEDRQEAVPPGDLAGRPVVGAAVMADKIRAAVDARSSAGLVISARTDALFSVGMAETLERAERYLEAGADMIFVEGCTKATSRREVAASFAGRVPLLFNAGILDREALPDHREFHELGYSMVLFPGNVVAQAAEAMQRALAEIRVWAGEAPPAPGVDLSTAIGTDAFMCRFN